MTYYSLPPLECYRTHPPLRAVYYQESRKLKQLEGNLGFHDVLIIYCCTLSYRMKFCHTLQFFSSKTALSETKLMCRLFLDVCLCVFVCVRVCVCLFFSLIKQENLCQYFWATLFGVIFHSKLVLLICPDDTHINKTNFE